MTARREDKNERAGERLIGCVMRQFAGWKSEGPWRCRYCGITEKSKRCEADKRKVANLA